MTDNSPNPSLAKIILIGLIGNVMEWYDFAVYGYFATIIGKLFFPASDPAVSLIASFGTFAAGFLVRPLGGLVLGRIGDLVGRQRAMTLSVMAMAVPTVTMALLPTYETAGIAAPILLIALRIVQGLSVGGEFTSSLIYLAEHAPPHRRALTAIWGNWGATAGILLGSGVGLLVSTLLSDDQLISWGWRVPFAMGGLVAITGWLIRSSVHADASVGQKRSPVKEVFTRYRGDVLRVALLNIGSGVAFYTAFVYAVSYIRTIDRLSESIALELNTLAMVVLLVVLPVAAWVSDRHGRKRLLVVAHILLLLGAVPLFQLIHSGNDIQILIGEILFALIVGAATAGMVALNVELMPAPIRCTGLAFAYNASMGLFGGTTPLMAAWLIDSTGDPIAPAYWVAATAALSLITLLFWVSETRHVEL
jgi:MHS family proline/betaine transporter-like MFS transporter